MTLLTPLWPKLSVSSARLDLRQAENRVGLDSVIDYDLGYFDLDSCKV
jgi:hypothetical protein